MQSFLELIEELGIECRVGHPQKIREADESSPCPSQYYLSNCRGAKRFNLRFGVRRRELGFELALAAQFLTGKKADGCSV
jgi:hypothetical protein